MEAVEAATVGFFSDEKVATLRLYRRNVMEGGEKEKDKVEHCYNVKKKAGKASDPEKAARVLLFLLRETFAPEDVGVASFIQEDNEVKEFGPRPTFASAWSSTCVSICQACGVDSVERIERSRRYVSSKPKDSLHDRMTECEYVDGVAAFFYEDEKKVDRSVKTIPLMEGGKAALEKANQESALGFDEFDLDYYHKLFAETLKRDPTDVELYDMSQSNSEHSRHWFFGGRQEIDGVEKDKSLFRLVKEPLEFINGTIVEDASLIAFSDNSSCVKGGWAPCVLPTRCDDASSFVAHDVKRHPVLTAETHNFPSAVAPFPGAETGTGGRIRDVQATGRGAHPCAGIAGYCVGDVQAALGLPVHVATEPPPSDYSSSDPESSLESTLEGLQKKADAAKKKKKKKLERAQEIAAAAVAGDDAAAVVTEKKKKKKKTTAQKKKKKTTKWPYPTHLASPVDILLQASDGASDYGNKFGEPVVAGFCRSFRGLDAAGDRCEWIKPIMFSGGLGWLDNDCGIVKKEPKPGMAVVKVGGPAYRIGLGGGAASSRVSTQGTAALDFDAVQRGDAQMCNRMNRVIRACIETKNRDNPILSIHDQGCGGNGNVLKEIVEGAGAEYDLGKFQLGDTSMTPLEVWGAEYQESNAMLINADDIDLLKRFAKRERCGLDHVGVVADSNNVKFSFAEKTVDDGDGQTTENNKVYVDLPLDVVLGKLPPKLFKSQTPKVDQQPPLKVPGIDETGEELEPIFRDVFKKVLALPSVGSKRFLVHKVDRSVTGLVARQQCVGPFQVPVCDVAVLARSHLSWAGCAVAVGEAPQCSALNPAAMARRCVAEVLTNLCAALVGPRHNIRLSANWMWAAKLPGEGARMYAACEALSKSLVDAQLAIDGGKDSLSMAAPDGEGDVVKAPGTLVLTAYASMKDVTKVLTPELQYVESFLICVDLALVPGRLGGTALAQVLGQTGDEVADCDIKAVAAAFDAVQDLHRQGKLLAYHDRSDGGLAVCVLEMAIASGRVGLGVDLPGSDWAGVMFDEAPGMVLQVKADDRKEVVDFLRERVENPFPLAARVDAVGKVLLDDRFNERPFTLSVGGEVLCLRVEVPELWAEWEAASFAIEKKQRLEELVDVEEKFLPWRTPPKYVVPFKVLPPYPHPNTHKIAVIRCEGSNGDREMAAAFYMAGMEPWDVTVSDLADGRITMDRFRGAVFVGGFSYADVCDSAKGWAAAILLNPTLRAQFDAFYARPDVFSLGVCNGCQLMALLGWVPGLEDTPKATDDDDDAATTTTTAPKEESLVVPKSRPRFVHNECGKFESRWVSLTILESKSVLLEGMAGATLGVWIAHGEGRAHFPDPATLQAVLDQNLAPLRYADDNGAPIHHYPFCPNGSPEGIAGLCSPDGRHLALMPHPERCILSWQWPWKNDAVANACVDAPNTGIHHASPWFRLFQNAANFIDVYDGREPLVSPPDDDRTTPGVETKTADTPPDAQPADAQPPEPVPPPAPAGQDAS